MKKYISIVCALAIGINMVMVPLCTKNVEAAVKNSKKTMYAGTTWSLKSQGNTYKTSNKKVAFVSKKGIVTAKNEGTAVITVKKGKTTKKIDITVKTNKKHTAINTTVDELKLSKPKIVHKNGEAALSEYITNKGSSFIVKVNAEYLVTAENSNPATGGAISVGDSLEKQYKVKASVKRIKKGKKAELKGSVSVADDLSIKKVELTKLVYHSGESKIVYYPDTGKWKASKSPIDMKAPVIAGLVGSKAYNRHYKDVVRTIYKEKKSWLLKYVSARDARDGKVKVTVDTSKINWKKKGTYTVIYRAKDKAGNVASVKTKVALRKSTDSYDRYASTILRRIVKESWSDEKKARAIYKYVRRKMAYVDSNDHKSWERSSVYALRYNSGNCFCFYSLARLLLTRCGIPNQTVTRYKGHSGHWWNLVYIRGGWYHFDTTPRRVRGWFCLWTDAQLTAYSNRAGHSHIWKRSWVPASPVRKIS